MNTRVARAVALLGPLLALTTAACSAPAAGTDTEETPSAPVSAPDPVFEVTDTLRFLRDDLAEIEDETGTELGISLYDGHINGHTGTIATLPSWSTVKVPIALSAQEHCSYSDAAISSMIESSIEWSDNASAYSLLQCVGEESVEEEVADAGAVIDVRSAFGRSQWPLASAARYAWHLSTLDEDNEVIIAMRDVVDGQRWGLGNLENAAFKGGWSGDRLDGSWHSRQLGFVRVDGQALGIAIAARSPAGSYVSTTEALDKLAIALGDELGLRG
ncbi:hypothetical protein [Corynebacterium qintianiae]|uniref:hypothetical protein n=1 Tax=Corynebacterium qintianiae TaxID=2709392 RepID=UPI0013ED932C|nr:hypothetical protein [Corynebacterium qintianiae]